MAESVSSSNVKTGTNIVIEKMLADYPGGVELDLTGVTTQYDANDGYIPAGTPIIDDAGDLKPLLAANLVADGGDVMGFLIEDIHKDEPYAAICIRGVVNEALLPFAINAAVKSAVPGISFI